MKHSNSKLRRKRTFAAARMMGPLATLLLVVGCGGSGHASTPDSPDMAATRAESTAAAPPKETAAETHAGQAKVASPVRHSQAPKPRIVWEPIPFGAQRKVEMVAYARRHYGSFMEPTWRLIDPRVIVIHYTDGPSFSSVYNTFASDTPDTELRELPGTCAHFVIDTNGTIYQLVSLAIMCRHTVGLNWTAIGIEHVGYSDQQVLGDRRQLTASLSLVRWLRCRFNIPIKDVIGHEESLSSPYHREDVPALRTQTHSDFNHADMQRYRARLQTLAGC